MMLYHHKLAPGGKVFNHREETLGLKSRGWVDSSAAFPKPSKVKISTVWLKEKWDEWEWATKAIHWILASLVAVLALRKC
jgi:hypothetical protein